MLIATPTESDLERVYWELAQRGGTGIGRESPWPYDPRSLEDLLALASDMTRYDARLLSILVQWTVAHYAEVNLLFLRRAMKEMTCPQALCVLSEFVRISSPDPELQHAMKYLQAGWEHLRPTEQFFVDEFAPQTRTAQRQLGRTLRPYSRWGFISTERPTVNPRTKATVGGYDSRTRRQILQDLLRRTPSLRLSDYLDAVDQSITRQQALADLREFKGLEVRGHGRGAHWVLTVDDRVLPHA